VAGEPTTEQTPDDAFDGLALLDLDTIPRTLRDLLRTRPNVLEALAALGERLADEGLA
jgi:hypothetical protein